MTPELALSFVYPVREIAQGLLESNYYSWGIHRKHWGRVLADLQPYQRNPLPFIELTRVQDQGLLVMSKLIADDHRFIRSWTDSERRYGLYILAQDRLSTEKKHLAARALAINYPPNWSAEMWELGRQGVVFLETMQTQLMEHLPQLP